MDQTVLLAALGIVSACVGGLIWIIKYLFNKITPVLEGLVKATDANTAATKLSDTYLRERNGRDNKMHTELVTAVGNISKQIATSHEQTTRLIKDHPISQTVKVQEVATQVVAGKQ